MSRDRSERGTQPADDVEDFRRRNAELEILYETVRDFTSTLAVHEVIERLLDRILHHLEAEIGSVLLLGSDGALRLVMSRGLPEAVSGTVLGLDEGISAYVLASAEPLLVDDVETDERFRRRNHERYYTHSCISAPLIFRGEARGVLNVNNKRSREAFNLADLRLLQAIAGHAALALGNAQRFEELLQRAERDTLTGLANHGSFWSTLDMELQRSRRYRRPLAVIMIDVDEFKSYNDRYGHLGGDRALVGVARAIAERCRSHDLVARYGGDEFAVVLESTLEGAFTAAENIRQTIEESDLGVEHGGDLTVSVGVAAFPMDATNPAELVRVADEQLYRAKSLGRNRVCRSGS